MAATQGATALTGGLRRWVALMQRRPLWVLGVAALLGTAAGRYVVTHLRVDTNPEHMLSAELPWRAAKQRMDRMFPALDAGLVAVLDGATPDAVDAAQRRLVAALREQPDQFVDVYAAETDPYFRRNGFLYLDTPSLQKLADRLNQAQPFLGALTHDPSLHGLFTLLDRAATNPGAGAFDLSPALHGIAESVDAAAAGGVRALSWQGLMGTGLQQGSATRRFIEIKPKLDFGHMFPTEAPIDAFRATVARLDLTPANGVTVRLSGSKAMEHDELKQAFGGGLKAFAAGLVVVIVLLYLALRSGRLVGAAAVTLLYGLLMTAGFAALAVGHLNLISIAFSVLYVGLGIDYALYLCMQYRELLGEGVAQSEALPRAAADVGGFIMVCTATTAIGFFGFVPTPFTGIAELGIISGAGMFISLVVSLSLLPALISLFPPAADKVRLTPPGRGLLGRVLEWPYTYSRGIWIGAGVLAVASLALVPKAYFDYNPIDLRDPNSESVSTFRDLLRDPSIPTLSMSVLVPDADRAKALALKLRALPEVRRAISVLDLVPANQDDKLAIVDDLNVSLGTALGSGAVVPVARDDDYATLRQVAADLPAYAAQNQGTSAADAARALLAALERLDQVWSHADGAAREALLTRLRTSLLAGLPAQIGSLRDALAAGPVTQEDLSPEVARRWLGKDEKGATWYRVEVWPKEVLDGPAPMERFVSAARAVAPDATGGAIGYIESGHAVVAAFKQAFLYSFIAIALLLVILLRSVTDVLLVLVPLVLAGLLTVAGSVLLHVPFNFANVIALPLILGVGVDYGVYLAQRSRIAAATGANILRTGTARAVLFGALITTANFGDLMLAKHPGIVSMGVLLTVGLSMTLVCALVLLPSLGQLRFRARA